MKKRGPKIESRVGHHGFDCDSPAVSAVILDMRARPRMQVVNEFAKMNGVLEEYSELACDWQVLIDSQGGLLPHGFGSHDRIQV